MKRSSTVLFCVLVLCAATASADRVLFCDGASYSEQCMGPSDGQIAFTDVQGIGYKFPVSDVQSLVFGRTQDTVTLRNGKVYAGQYNGSDLVAFRDVRGIDYNFPLRDLETIIFTQDSAPPATIGVAVVIPQGAEIVVRNNETIDLEHSTLGQFFSAVVSEDVPDSCGGIAIPRRARARLVVRNITTGGAVHSSELALDLFSVDTGGKEHRVDSTDVDVNSGRGVGKNKRTLEYAREAPDFAL
jgi:hypothetical protein